MSLKQHFLSPLKRHQLGLSLIELMISMLIGLLIVAGALQLYVGMIRNSGDMASTNAQIENGRFILQILENDLLQSGFWNGYVPQFDDLTFSDIPSDYPAAIPEPCKAFSSWDAAYKTELLGVSVQTYDAVPTGCESLLIDKKANTDVLVVRHADLCIPGTSDCDADTTGSASPKVYFQSQFCGNDPASQYVYVFDIAGFTLQKRSCVATDLAEKRKYVSNIYYIRNDDMLVRAEFGGGGGTTWNSQPLIEGVEGFVVELGVDNLSDTGAPVDYTQAINWVDVNNKTSPTNRGDGSPDGNFVHCSTAVPCNLATYVNTVAAKIYVLVRNDATSKNYTDTKTYTLGATTLGPFNDEFKRHVYSTTIRLANVSARRQTP